MERRSFHILGMLLMLTALSESGVIPPKESPSGDGEIPLNKHDKKLGPNPGIWGEGEGGNDFGIYEFDMGDNDPDAAPDYDYGKPGEEADMDNPGIIIPEKIPPSDEKSIENHDGKDNDVGKKSDDEDVPFDGEEDLPTDEDESNPNHKDIDEPDQDGNDEKEEDDDRKVLEAEDGDDDEVPEEDKSDEKVPENDEDRKEPVDDEEKPDEDDESKKEEGGGKEENGKPGEDDESKEEDDEKPGEDNESKEEEDDEKSVEDDESKEEDDDEKPGEDDESKEEDDDEKPDEDDKNIGGGEESGFFSGASIFDTPFFNVHQVQKYFSQLERALGHVFKQTLDEAALLNGTYANTTEEEVEIDGKKYIVHKSLIKGADNHSSIYVEALSSVPKINDTQEIMDTDVKNATHS